MCVFICVWVLLASAYDVVTQDIRGLLTEWADEIAGCERVFIRASVSNRRIFLDYDGSVLSKSVYIAFLLDIRSANISMQLITACVHSPSRQDVQPKPNSHAVYSSSRASRPPT